jgi:DNA-binding PadR family transcriptional regulator
MHMETARSHPPQTGLTLTEYAVLGLLGHLGPHEVSGYDVKKFADKSLAYLWAPSKTQLYAALGGLVRAGLAARRDVPQRHRPDKQLYRLTEAGATAVREWLERPEDETDPDRSIFMLKFFLGRQAEHGALVPQLRAFRQLFAERLRIYEETRDLDDPPSTRDEFTFAALRFGIARARAAVDWADETLRELER